MLPFEKGLQIVLEHARLLGTEKVSLTDALNRVLASDVASDIDMPPFDKSAVDGFACRISDIKNELECIETVPAGVVPKNKVTENKCIKIMTGAMIPEGADCVLMVEHTATTDNKKIRFVKENTAKNICYRGEDVKKGEVVLKKGTLLNPEHIAVLAAVGCSEPLVSKMPVISILTTGDELVEPHEIPASSQIRNSNAWQLMAQATRMNVPVNYGGIIKDDKETTLKAISEHLEKSDVVLLTGGVSMGDFDMVPEMMKKAGVEILFQTLAIQPGKPTVFGHKGEKIIFGLPGNPVASFMIFELMVKSLLYKMMGHDFQPLTFKMTFGSDYKRKSSERMSVLPVNIVDDKTVIPVIYHGSAHIHALTNAQGFIFVAAGQSVIAKGETVDVRLF